MRLYLSFVTLASVLVSVYVSLLLTPRIVVCLGTRAGRPKRGITVPPQRAAFVFAVVFVLVWIVVSVLLASPLLVLTSG